MAGRNDGKALKAQNDCPESFCPYRSVQLRTTMTRLLILLLFVLLCPQVHAAPHAFIVNHCLDCHDSDSAKGGLNLEQLPAASAGKDALAKWILVHDQVRSGEMPPKKKSRVTTDERAAFVGSLRAELIATETEIEERRGKGMVRRLNRTEYENTLRDLLHLPLLRVKEMLPEDGQQHGFDKVPGALELSHVQMRKYLATADKALRQALVPAKKRPVSRVWRESAVKQGSGRGAIATHNAAPLLNGDLAPGLTTRVQGDPVKNKGNSYRSAHFDGEADALAVFSGVLGAHQPQGIQPDRFRVTTLGWYRVRFSTWGMRWNRGRVEPAVRSVIRQYRDFELPVEPHPTERWRYTRAANPEVRENEENTDFHGEAKVVHVVRASLKGEVLGFFDAPSLRPTEHEFKVWLEPGEKLSFHVMSLPGKGPANWGTADGVRGYEGPAVVYDWFELEGPITEQWPPASHRRLLGDPEREADIEQLLVSFASEAFRRPVEVDEIRPYAAIVNRELANGARREDALVAGYKALLSSPDFLFIGLEGTQSLASRLSYFLWNSMPDASLRTLSATGELANPETLRREIDRLLQDPRSDRFIDHFLDQWLAMKDIDFTTPDPQLYPEFDPWLRDSMLEETRAYFRQLLTENRSIDHLIDSDFVLINQRLAELYEIKGVAGSRLREVALKPDSPRGGFLTQAAVLKVTANGTATSPVLRGVWVVEQILGIPRRPPPPNVPAVEPDATGAVTIRQQIEQHRADPACASCHRVMDPPGLALESFDVIGGYRERYRAGGRPKMVKLPGKPRKELEPHFSVLTAKGRRVQIRIGGEVDPSGELADGRRFADINGLREHLLRDREALARNVARQFAIYATGKGYRFSDRDQINAIVQRTANAGYGFRSLLEQVVLSPLFMQPQ